MAKDPYKYFRIEARELCEHIASGILDLDKLPFDGELTARLLRFAHTLKGAARVVKQLEIARRSHALEEVLLAKREAQAPATREEVQTLLGLIDEVSSLVASLATPEAEALAAPVERPVSVAPPAPVVPPAQATAVALLRQQPAEEVLQTLRVDVEQMDVLIRGVSTASQRMASLRRDLSGLERLADLAGSLVNAVAQRTANPGLTGLALFRVRTLAEGVDGEIARLQRELSATVNAVDAELNGVRETAHQLRLVPASTLFPPMERVLYDAAELLGKRVAFEAVGGDVRLDSHVLTSLRDALLHVVRNAVAHGIETPEQRHAQNKPERGSVRVVAARRGNRVVFSCQDDGRGIDLEAVRRVAVERGLVSTGNGANLSQSELFELLTKSGLSTSRQVTEIAGHGIGLDVVKEVTTRLKGSLNLDSTPGVGTRIEIEVPVSVAAVLALMIEVGGARLAIPLDAVVATARVAESDIGRVQGRESLLHEEQVIPFVALEQVLPGHGVDAERRKSWSVVVLRVAGRCAALGVDRVVGTSSIVMRALSPLVCAEAVVAGAALDAEGHPELVLEPTALLDFATRHVMPARAPEPDALPPILVVDDSLTTRMLEQSILQSAGYHVDLAVSAEDGLEKARLKRYGLFIVDVEMPGMSGFDFVGLTRADAELGKTPAILVTSRDAAEDRLRGERAGASAYIIKGEFEQGHLLRTIRSLMG